MSQILIDAEDLDIYVNKKLDEFIENLISELQVWNNNNKVWCAGANTRRNEILNTIERLRNGL